MNQVKMVLIFAILLFLFCVNVSAQVIKGRVTDSTTNEALSYAAVEIRSFEDDVYIGGSSTNEKGEFEFHLKGRYPKIRITVSFLGYKTISICPRYGVQLPQIRDAGGLADLERGRGERIESCGKSAAVGL